MKIVIFEWRSVGTKDLEEAFRQEGHSLLPGPFSIEGKTYGDLPELERQFATFLHEKTPDLVFTVNYYPAISNLCNQHGIRYVSWIYDAPYSRLFSQTVANPCNQIYVFDRKLYLECHNAGISTVHYLPMAVNVERVDALLSENRSDKKKYAHDVSFVGSLYLENSNAFIEMENSLSDYAKGYLDAMVAAQLKIQGYNFLEEVIGPVIDELCKVCPIAREPGALESREYYYAQYIIGDWMTALERIDLMEAIAQTHKVDLYTQYEQFSAPGITNHGIADYYTEMPLIFNRSKINLNITRRGIHSGMPLRAVDIMGCGGFLLSNFQADFLEHFVPGEDFVYYDSKEDLLRKVDYYLSHEEERQAIAKNGHDKIAAAHTYRHRVREMLDGLC